MKNIRKLITKAISIALSFLLFIITSADYSVENKALSRTNSNIPNLPILLGIYPNKGDTSEISQLNAYLTSNGGQNVSIGGTFIDLTSNPYSYIQSMSSVGVIPFVNMMIGTPYTGRPSICYTVDDIINHVCDNYLYTFSQSILTWSNQENPKGTVYIAFLPEMNGSWVTYYNGYPDASKFINAYLYVRNYFNSKGISSNIVQWVFAPDAIGSYPFESFYPGHNNVDVLAISRFNTGNCGTGWVDYSGFIPYLQRMTSLDGSKPIFISQTGMLYDSNSLTDRATWIYNLYSNLATYPALRAILYFNYTTNECGGYADYRFFINNQTGNGESGFLSLSVSNPSLYYNWSISNSNWSIYSFNNYPDIFEDIYRIQPFTGLQDYVTRLYDDGITSGCSSNPPMYCPNNYTGRDQMAILLLKSKYGSSYSPPSPIQYFTDVPNTYWAAAWIDELYREGIVSGCGGGNYCPTNPVTRDQMAVFLLRAKHGSSYSPPPSTQIFADVPSTYWAFNWINELYNEGITSGCGGGNYCPLLNIIRKDIAIFLIRTFNLP